MASLAIGNTSFNKLAILAMLNEPGRYSKDSLFQLSRLQSNTKPLTSTKNTCFFFSWDKIIKQKPEDERICPPKRDHVERKCHLPTIDFQGRAVSFSGV